ncbi:hypothetical protein ACFL2V_16455, partial [Pseudomonadota bacterium]
QSAADKKPASFMPVYGNWCGPDHPKDIHNATAPIDLLDTACRTHDFCYEARGYLDCGCDKTLNDEIHTALTNKQYQGKQSLYAHSFRIYFKTSPCAGDHSDKIAPSRVIHSLVKKVGSKTTELIKSVPFWGSDADAE